MSVRACTCGAGFREEAGIKPITGVGFHFKDCASLLPDPDTCSHTSGVRRRGALFCGACGKGLTEGGPAWISAKYEPGYGERLRKDRLAQEKKKQDDRDRERTYDLSGIYLDMGITDLSNEELERLIDCCKREIQHRASQPVTA